MMVPTARTFRSGGPVTTIVLGPRPPELEALLERRRLLGQDSRDEVWEGSYVMAPDGTVGHSALRSEVGALLREVGRAQGLMTVSSLNLGGPDDYRIPDGALLERGPSSTYRETAVLVVEVLSPDDESLSKVSFYTAHGVRELLVVDGGARTVRCLALQDGQVERDRSDVLGLEMRDIEAHIDWPEG